MMFKKIISVSQLLNDSTKRSVFIKFILLLLLLLTYTSYLSYQYGFATGGHLALITWSFFVLCTPVADAGMVLDFPIRFLFRVRMWVTESLVWGIAISINFYTLFLHPEIYEKSLLGHVFYGILTNPFPYWIIIILSFFGTFLSVHFADELLDYVNHTDLRSSMKHRILFEGIVIICIFSFILITYHILLKKLGINLSDF